MMIDIEMKIVYCENNMKKNSIQKPSQKRINQSEKRKQKRYENTYERYEKILKVQCERETQSPIKGKLNSLQSQRMICILKLYNYSLFYIDKNR